ncbi:MAG: urease subunit gamma [Streptosporangiaceae bacterium]
MRLTPRETERLTIFTLAELARRRRARGRLLNAPEATALICDEMLEAAWDGASAQEVAAIGRQVLTTGDVMDGVAALVDLVEVDCLFPSGTSLVSVPDPIGPPGLAGPPGPGGPGGPASTAAVAPGENVPGEVTVGGDPLVLNAGRRGVELEVRNDGDRMVFVSSHYPFAQVNDALSFDRDAAAGMRLDIAAGASLAIAPGERHIVALIAFAGTGYVPELRTRTGHHG